MTDLNSASEMLIETEKRPREKYVTLSLIIGAIALIGCLIFGALYYMANADEKGLASELLSRKDQLANHRTVASLENELSAIQDRLKGVRTSHEEARRLVEETYSSGGLDNGSILEAVVDLADDYDVNIITMSTQPGTYSNSDAAEGSNQIGIVEYNSLSFQLQATGALSDLVDYIIELEQGDLRTVRLDSVSITDGNYLYTVTLNFSVVYPRL